MNEDNIVNCLASYAVFRELFEKKKDIFTVIEYFMLQSISTRSLQSCTYQDIHRYLCDDYKFRIPTLVVKSVMEKSNCLKRTGSASRFFVITSLVDETLHQSTESSIDNGKTLAFFDKLITYIKEKTNKSTNWSKDDTDNVALSFYEFLFKNGRGSYSEFFASFIMEEQKGHSEIKELLNKIQEAIILMKGLNFKPSNDNTCWNDRLVIILAQEIFFSMAGYNQELYKSLFFEFYELVKEINTRSSDGPIIELYLFPSIKRSIHSYFNFVKKIMDENYSYRTDQVAAETLLHKCKNSTELFLEETNFYHMVEKLGVKENTDFEPDSISSDRKLAFETCISNLHGSGSYDSLLEKFDYSVYDISLVTSLISRNTDRKQNFLLLSNSRTTNYLSRVDSIKNRNSSIPVVASIDYLTERFWYCLNKGLGTNGYPISFMQVTQAQLLLSSKLFTKIRFEFLKAKKDYDDGLIEQDEYERYIVSFRNAKKLPEEVTPENAASILDDISEDGLERRAEEYSFLQSKLDQTTTQIIQKDTRISQLQKNKDDLKDLYKEKETLTTLISGQEMSLSALRRKEQKLLRKVRLKVLFCFIFLKIIMFPLVLIIVGVKLDLINIISLLATILGSFLLDYIWLFVTGHELSPVKIYESQVQKAKNMIYKKYDFEDIEISRIKESLSENYKRIEDIEYLIQLL